MKESHAGTAKAEIEVERQKGLALVDEKSATNALNDVVSLRDLVGVANTREVELGFSASAVSSQIVRTTAELRQGRDMISMQRKELQ